MGRRSLAHESGTAPARGRTGKLPEGDYFNRKPDSFSSPLAVRPGVLVAREYHDTVW